ncbi:MAG: response regulator [Streptosporangiaceae bacterium]
MEPGVNILIVEDEKEWQGTYERAVNAQFTGRRVSVAEDLASAERLIDATKFAVAFVDVGLDVRNDRNVDGLRVMEKIRSIGDEETSIVVITGRSGQDLLDIVRDAIKKYGAYDTVGKRSVAPKRIRELLAEGIDAYHKAVGTSRTAVHDVLRGDLPPMSWDDQVMRAIGFRGDAGRFYSFLGGILDDYLPVVTRAGAEPVFIDPAARLVHGAFWSRAAAAAVAVCFGAAAQFDQAAEDARRGGKLLGRYLVREPERELSGHEVKGAVFPLREARREDFGVPRIA